MVAGCVVEKRIITICCVHVADRVPIERLRTIGRISRTGCIGLERCKAVGCIGVAAGIVSERLQTNRGIVTGCREREQRSITKGRVIGPGGQVEEGTGAARGIAVGGLTGGRKPKPGNGDCDQRQTAA